jgi:cell division protein FtsN
MPRDYKNNTTYRNRKPVKKPGLDGWDRLLIVVFITVLALVAKHFIMLERAKTEEASVPEQILSAKKEQAKVATASSTAAAVAKEMAAAGGLTDEELNADPAKIAAQQGNSAAEAQAKPPASSVPPHQDTMPVEPHFDFYTILPKVEVVIPDHEIKTRIREEKLGEGDKNAKYMMQAGSFRSSPEAETLKAKLTALGIESRVEKAQVGEAMWYRVKVGPYAGMSSVMAVKSQLRDSGVDAIVFEFK